MTKFLIVDDSPEDRLLYRRMLRRLYDARLQLVETELGEEGLELLDQERPDCVLLDYNLPDMDGLDFLRQRAATIRVPIIVLTGQGNETVAVEAMQLGAKDYLVKGTITADALGSSVRNALNQNDLEIQLEAKQKEIETFAYTAAHDLKSPAQKIRGFTQILLSDVDLPKNERHDLTARVHKSAVRLSGLIDDLLNYALHGRGDDAFELVDLSEIVQTSLEQLEPQIDASGAEVSIGTLPSLRGDPTSLLLFFQNLIANGIKFQAPESGPPEISVRMEVVAKECHICVRDNGIGIDSAQVPAVFEPFTRLASKAKFEGTGLGLATAKKVAEQHGGRIEVQSEIGQGSEFRLCLPLDNVEISACASSLPVRESLTPAAESAATRESLH